MSGPQAFSNKLGIVGWLAGGRWGVERYLYTLHRMTGLGILFYFVLHVFVTWARLFGPVTWEKWMGVLKTPFFAVGEFAVFAAFVFHALNGIRLILIELGFAVGKAEEPVYPYRSSLNAQRPLMVVMMVFVVVLVLVGAYEFVGMAH